MIKVNMSRTFVVVGFCCSMLLGCASAIQPADISNTADPHEEVSRLETDLKNATLKNVDVLSASEFKDSETYLSKAKEAIHDGKSQSVTLDDLRASRGYLDKAVSQAANRQEKAEGLFAARQMTMKAGAYDHPELQSDLKSLDSDVANHADDLSHLSSEKIVALQNRYVDLERRAVVLNELGKTQAAVNGAKKNGAEDRAPVSYKAAVLSIKSAESMISTNVRNPDGYQAAVAKAHKDADQLANVMSMIAQNGHKLEESVAIKMVAQNGAISNLKSDLNTSEANNSADEAKINAKSAALGVANKKVRIQTVLESARSEFSKDEAEAYQQGDNLVIRLKKMNFANGRSDLPADSLALLAKVSDVAKSLNPSLIIVEGHTDSVGAANVNKNLSESRASAVASFFKTNGLADIDIKSEGFGFSKPIATNKSKEGRAQNRRVDIVITPETSKQ